MIAPIALKFTMTRAEYIRAVRIMLLRQKVLWFLPLIAAMWIFGPLLSAWLTESMGQTPIRLEPVKFIAYAVAAVAVLTVVYGWSPIAAVNKMNPAIRDNPQEFRFTEGGIDCSTGLTQSKVDWNLWVKFTESREFFFLYQHAQMAHILPKRAFASESEIAAFRDLLAKKIRKA